jgi:membrane protein DedA with SNARE-associated domain
MTGYFGVFILMMMESTAIPLPSELVMPFAGYLAYQAKFNIFAVCIISALGTVFGAMVSYYIGQYGGEPFLERYGNYFFINKKDLEKTHNWFKKSGDRTIFISRFIPVVRHLISIPAGIAEMDKKKFIFYTFLGGLIWNSFLAYLGYQLGKNWELVHEYTRPLSYAMVVLIILGVIYFVYKHIYKK